MANRFTNLLSKFTVPGQSASPGPGEGNPSPFEDVGAPGFAVFNGWVQTKETNSQVIGQNRWRNYSDVATNTSIVAAGMRSFFNLIQRTEWSVDPACDLPDGKSSDQAKEIAETIEAILNDMRTPWAKVATKASNYKFYGFSWAEWIAKKNEDGTIGLLDIRVRPQHTIQRWDIDDQGSEVFGVWQTLPTTGAEVYLPRKKSLYLVDDLMSDSPIGSGLLRHCIEPALKLKEYLRNEAVGIQRDLRGIPIARVPYDDLNQKVKAGEMTKARRDALIAAMEDIVQIQSKAENTGLVIDSAPYKSKTETGETISSVYKWGVEVMSGVGTASSIADTGVAIDRLNREIARILGVEHLMLGDGSGGNRALSEDKSRNFFLQMEGTLADVADAADKDIIERIMELNGFDMALKPTLSYEAVQFKDVAKITAALRDMATAGAVMAPDDPAIDDVRALLGISPQPEDIFLETEENEDEEPTDDPIEPSDDMDDIDEDEDQ